MNLRSKLIIASQEGVKNMKLAIAAFAAAVLVAFGGAVFAQEETMTPSPSPSPTTQVEQPAGAPSTGFGAG